MKRFNRDVERTQAQNAFVKGDLRTAEEMCLRLLKQDKKDFRSQLLLGQVYRAQGRCDEAGLCYQKCLKQRPRDASVYFLLGALSFTQGKMKEAIAKLDRAIKLKPNYEAALVEKGYVYERLNQYDAARDIIAQLLDRGFDSPALTHLRCKAALHDKQYQEAVELAAPLIEDERTNPTTRRQLAFIRGRALDKLGHEREAMEAWRLANSLLRNPFDPLVYSESINELLAGFRASNMNTLARATNESELPVFIAGMPRSGTTLVEQIIDAHPQAVGVGELDDIDKLCQSLPELLGTTEGYPSCLHSMTATKAERIASPYLRKLKSLSQRRAERVVNKSLENYKNLGLIALLFPKARVVYCRRDPMDTCLSIYMNTFLPDAHPYASDLRHIGHVFRESERLMAHWLDVLELPILEVRYEELVADQATHSRRIIEFCGLNWEEKCLRFHESKRPVMTLSYHQVSQPIYQSAVKRWERYREFLGPLQEILESPRN